MYDLLVDAARVTPVIGNQDGSYLTMKSNQGFVFGAAAFMGGFSGVFCDQGADLSVYTVNMLDLLLLGYWQRVRLTKRLIYSAHHWLRRSPVHLSRQQEPTSVRLCFRAISSWTDHLADARWDLVVFCTLGVCQLSWFGGSCISFQRT
jgi:hypothetical protein